MRLALIVVDHAKDVESVLDVLYVMIVIEVPARMEYVLVSFNEWNCCQN